MLGAKTGQKTTAETQAGETRAIGSTLRRRPEGGKTTGDNNKRKKTEKDLNDERQETEGGSDCQRAFGRIVRTRALDG